MGKIDAMWFFQKMMTGAALLNAIGMAVVDKKITASEVAGMVNIVLQGISSDVKVSPGDISIISNVDGSCDIHLSAELMSKLEFSM